MKIIILVGGICAGKSTYAASTGYPVISRDHLRSVVFNQPYNFTKENEKVITMMFNQLVTENIAYGYNCIILDNTHCKEKYIDELIEKYKNYTIQVFFFDLPLWKAHFRNVIRWVNTGKWIPIKVVNSMHKNYKKINKEKYKQYV